MTEVNGAVHDLYGDGDVKDSGNKDHRLTAISLKWSSSGLGLTAAENEARRLEKKGTFTANMDDEAGTVTLSTDDFKKVMGKLGGHKEVAKRSQTNLIFLAFGYLAVSIGFIAVIVGLMNWRIEAAKDSRVASNTLVGVGDKSTDVVQTASMKVKLPLLVAPVLPDGFEVDKMTVSYGTVEETFTVGSIQRFNDTFITFIASCNHGQHGVAEVRVWAGDTEVLLKNGSIFDTCIGKASCASLKVVDAVEVRELEEKACAALQAAGYMTEEEKAKYFSSSQSGARQLGVEEKSSQSKKTAPSAVPERSSASSKYKKIGRGRELRGWRCNGGRRRSRGRR